MNWGKKILFFYLTFVAGIVFLVVKSANQELDLVTTDYYKQELKYQEKIDQSARAHQLKGEIRLKQENDKISVEFPVDFTGKAINGKVHIYCPNDEKQDKIQEFSIEDGKEVTYIEYPHPGLKTVKIEWESEGLSYYKEQKIFLQ